MKICGYSFSKKAASLAKKADPRQLFQVFSSTNPKRRAIVSPDGQYVLAPRGNKIIAVRRRGKDFDGG